MTTATEEKKAKEELKALVEGLQKSPDAAKLDEQKRAFHAEEEASADPGPIQTEQGMLSVEDLIRDGRTSVKDWQLTPAVKIDMSILTHEERSLTHFFIDKTDPNLKNPDAFAEEQRLAIIALSVSKINMDEFPLIQNADKTWDLEAKQKLFSALKHFPASAVGLIWLKYFELDDANPFMSIKKKS